MNKNLSFSVSAQRIELTDAAMLVAGTVNEYTGRFTFDESWDGYQRTAVFSCGDISREQLLTDAACRVPWEVLVSNGYLRVGVYGTKDGSRLPTIWTERRLYINPGAGPTQESEDPSPTLVEQLLGRMGDLAALKTEDKSSLVAAINEVWSSGGSGGASVTDAAINEDGHLIITLSTGEIIDAGYAVGPAGAPGAAGKDGQDGAPGKDGAAGAPGKDGVGIQSVDQTTTSTDDGGTNIITVTKSDGSSSTFHVRNGSKGSTGPAGADGAPGKDGLGVPAATAEDAGKVPVVQADGSYELGSQISPPETAKVGQTIVVKTVDADGKPTEWEAADMHSGGGPSGGGHWETVLDTVWEQDVINPTAYDSETGIFTCASGELNNLELNKEYVFYTQCVVEGAAYNTVSISYDIVKVTKLSDTTFSIDVTLPTTFVPTNVKLSRGACLAITDIDAKKIRLTLDGQFHATATNYDNSFFGAGKPYFALNTGYQKIQNAYQAYQQVTAEVESPYRIVGEILCGFNAPSENASFHFKNNSFCCPLIPFDVPGGNARNYFLTSDGTKIAKLYSSSAPWFLGGVHENNAISNDYLKIISGTKVKLERWVE